MHQLQNNKLPKLFQNLFRKIGTVQCAWLQYQTCIKEYLFSTKSEKRLLKICRPLEGQNSGQTLTMFI